MNTVVIIGSNGQDGKLLSECFDNSTNWIFQISKNQTKKNGETIFPHIDITKKNIVKNFIKDIRPNEIYYLASHHHNSEYDQNHNLEEFRISYQINVQSYLYFLDGIRFYSPFSKIFYSSSSHIFGEPLHSPQNEDTPFNPTTIYGLNKLNAIYLSRLYKKNYKIFSSIGIMYTHESKYRKSYFLSKKIIRSAINIKKGIENSLEIANPNSVIDWGYAGDYVKAMKIILSHSTPEEFVISSGSKSKLYEFINHAFSFLGLDYEEHLIVKKKILKRSQINNLYGDSGKLQSLTEWRPTFNIKELAEKLVKDELRKIK